MKFFFKFNLHSTVRITEKNTVLLECRNTFHEHFYVKPLLHRWRGLPQRPWKSYPRRSHTEQLSHVANSTGDCRIFSTQICVASCKTSWIASCDSAVTSNDRDRRIRRCMHIKYICLCNIYTHWVAFFPLNRLNQSEQSWKVATFHVSDRSTQRHLLKTA